MHMCECVCVCMCVCTCVWCSDYVLGSGPEVPEFKPHSGNFPSGFSIFLLPAIPVHPAVIEYLVFAGVQIQGLFGTSGPHTTCCEERPILL